MTKIQVMRPLRSCTVSEIFNHMKKLEMQPSERDAYLKAEFERTTLDLDNDEYRLLMSIRDAKRRRFD